MKTETAFGLMQVKEQFTIQYNALVGAYLCNSLTKLNWETD